MRSSSARSGPRTGTSVQTTPSTAVVALLFAAALVLAAGMVLLLFSRPPGQAPAAANEPDGRVPVSLMREGGLPGVTWADDIHPIFVRNGCGRCHTRGSEAVAGGGERYTLGLIDPADEKNPYWSFHELVHVDGPATVQKDESVRDGSSAWPRGMVEEERRRIWLGRPERSVIMRKLERDYYDWREPPRYVDEALALTWGAPMPFFEDLAGQRIISRMSLLDRAVHHSSLWLGLGRDSYKPLPPRLSARDRELLRHWISNTSTLGPEGARLKVTVVDFLGNPVPEATVLLVGDYQNPERQAVTERIEIRSDEWGQATVEFVPGSLVSSRWYISAETDELGANYRGFDLVAGKNQEFKIVVLTKTSDEGEADEEE